MIFRRAFSAPEARGRPCGAALLLLCALAGRMEAQQQHPKPRAHPGLTFHAAPKALAAGARSEDWPTFLGPAHNGVSRESPLLREWPAEGPRLVWEMEVGTGFSAPSIAGDKLVFFHRLKNEEIVECLHPATGARYWHISYPTDYRDRYGYSNGPRSTPVIDGDRVYTLGVQGKLHCLDLESGEILWKRDLAKEFALRQGFFGIATTPLVEGGLLIVNIGAPRGPSVVAFDKRSGERVWEAKDKWGGSYASPVPALIHGERRVFVFAGGESNPPTGGLLCINPADGHIDFRFPWRSRQYESVNAACPVVIGDLVFISASYRTGGALLRVTPEFKGEVEWKTRKLGTHFGTAIHRDGYLYGFDGRNEGDAALVCLDIKNGKQLWRFVPQWRESFMLRGRRSEGIYSTFRGQLLLADGHFLVLGELGHLLWMDLSPQKHEILARTWLFAAQHTWTPPVLSKGLLYIEQNQRDVLKGTPPRLLCYDLRAELKE